MENKTILTKEGKKKLQDELKHLLEVERPKVIAEIAEARAQGDLSENAEFDSAREKQGEIEGRIGEITAILEEISVVRTNKDNSKVNIGSTVVYMDLDDNEANEVTIVGSLEADPLQNKISNVSPLGEALLGKAVGDKAKVMVDNKYDIEIIEIKEVLED